MFVVGNETRSEREKEKTQENEKMRKGSSRNERGVVGIKTRGGQK